ncbi:MAG: hypothetical protein U9O94_06145 [Nanoarchaeota archaeon]|nr:hypothetical protein [Nanoarchaeota archaeon]
MNAKQNQQNKETLLQCQINSLRRIEREAGYPYKSDDLSLLEQEAYNQWQKKTEARVYGYPRYIIVLLLALLGSFGFLIGLLLPIILDLFNQLI